MKGFVMMWQRVFRQWFVLVLVLVCMTSCELERNGTSTALPEVECEPGEWEHKGQCVPAGLPPDMPCPPGETLLDDGRCQPAGLPLDMKCQPGELELEDGKCQPAGVPPEMCGEGFEPDGKMGCNAILPAEACPFGLMAVPGETECREVAPCPKTTYPEFPLDPTHPQPHPTQFVNAAYAGSDSDGTRTKPWKTIQAGIDAAEPGDVVAIAAGTYEENLFINKSLKLWGVCPKKVAVVGTSATNAAIAIFGDSASETELHNVAILGKSGGITSFGAINIIVDRAWIHDTKHAGIWAANFQRPASVTVLASLIERTHLAGIVGIGAGITVTNSLVRDTLFANGFASGIGVEDDDEPAQLAIRGSVIERLADRGVGVMGADVQIASTVVRDIAAVGVAVKATIIEGTIAKRAKTTISQTVVMNTKTAGIFIESSDATIRGTVVKNTQLDPASNRASGIRLDGPHGENGAQAEISASVIENGNDVGISVTSSTAMVQSSIIRGTVSTHKTPNGIGILGQVDNMSKRRSSITITGAIIEHNETTGIFAQGADVSVDSTMVRNQGRYGIAVRDDFKAHVCPNAVIQKSAIVHNHVVGVVVEGADMMLDASVVRGTLPNQMGMRGQGVMIVPSIDENCAANAFVQASIIDKNYGRGIEIQDADIKLERAVIAENVDVGVLVVASNMTMQFSVVRGTRAIDEMGALGVAIQERDRRSDATIHDSLVEQNQGIGVLVSGSSATIETTVISESRPEGDRLVGRGINVQMGEHSTPSLATIRRSLVKKSGEIGIFITSSDVLLDATAVKTTSTASDEQFGDGVAVIALRGPAKTTISKCLIEDSDRRSIANFGGTVELRSSILQCGTFDMSTQSFGGQTGAFLDRGGNRCGCPDASGTCRMATNAALEPTPQLPPLSPSLQPPL